MLLGWESSSAEDKLAVRLEAEVSGPVCTGSPPSSWQMKSSWLSRELSWKESTRNLLCHPLVCWLYQGQSADRGWRQLLKAFPVLHRAHAGDLRSTSAVISALPLVVGHLHSWPLAARCPAARTASGLADHVPLGFLGASHSTNHTQEEWQTAQVQNIRHAKYKQ